MILDTHTARNARIDVACHRLADGAGRPLLLLHALHGSARDWLDAPAWPGPVHAIDFSGHGDSAAVRGGGYTPELFVADADAALGAIVGEGDDGDGIVLAGAGMGAYIALLLAGARPDLVHAALLGPGEGLGETDGEPDFERTPERMRHPGDLPAGCDPALWRYIGEIKPRDYVESFARRARRLLLIDDGGFRPVWWRIAGEAPRAEKTGPDWAAAFEALARTP